jgi:hypothetical protein
MNRRCISEHRIDHAPRRFDGTFTNEEPRVTTNGIASGRSRRYVAGFSQPPAHEFRRNAVA